MTKEQFVEKIVADLKVQLDPSLEIISREIEKDNGVKKTGINIIEEGNPASPTIYIDGFYDKFITMEMSYSEGINIIKDTYEKGCIQRDAINQQAEKMQSFESIKDNLRVRIATEEMNQSETYSYVKKGDFKILPYVELKNDEEGVYSSRVNENLLKIWGKTIEEVCEVAISNYSISDYKLFDLETIAQQAQQIMMLEEMSGVLDEKELKNLPEIVEPENLLETNDSLEDFGMLVLTNDAKFNGANALLMEDLLEKIHEKTGEDFIILPSSMHEVMIVPNPEKFHLGLERMAEMVTEVNDEEVEPEERLSNKVYRYDSQRKEVVDAYKYEQRKVLDSIDENTNNEITSFVEELDNFLYDYDVYEYHDTVGSDIEDREVFKQTNCSAVKLGETEHIKGFLNNIIEETEQDSVKNDAKKLLDDMDKIQNQIYNTKDSSLEVSKSKSL